RLSSASPLSLPIASNPLLWHLSLPFKSHPDVLQLYKFILSTNPKVKDPKGRFLWTSIYFSIHQLTSLSYAIAPPFFIQKRSHPDVLQLHKFILSTNPKIKHPKRGLLCTSIYFSVRELTSLSYAIAPPLFIQKR